MLPLLFFALFLVSAQWHRKQIEIFDKQKNKKKGFSYVYLKLCKKRPPLLPGPDAYHTLNKIKIGRKFLRALN